MPVVSLHDRDEIERYLRQNPLIHLYELGDLDDFFWQYTTWYALKEGEQIQALLLLYISVQPPIPVLLAISENLPVLRTLLQSSIHLLPPRFYAHLSGD